MTNKQVKIMVPPRVLAAFDARARKEGRKVRSQVVAELMERWGRREI